jgi:hypothetical protein
VNIVDANEGPESSPYLRLALGKVTAVHFQAGGQGTPSSSAKALDDVLGRVDVQFVDRPGSRTLLPIAFPSFSNPVAATDTTNPSAPVSARCYGDISLPSPGDIVLVGFRSPSNAVVLGCIPANYYQQTSTDLSKPAVWGTMRAVQPGEMSRLSFQQAELWHDKAGAVQIVVKAQPMSGNAVVDGSATTSVTDIDPTQVPKTELARVTVGECYTDDTFIARDVGASGKKLALRVKMASGAAIKIDTAGNVELTAAPNMAVTINGGQNGVARLNDQTKSTNSDDSNFWGFLSAFVQAFQTWNPVPLDGGAALKTQLTTVFAQYPLAPSSLTGKITAASQTVKAG